MDKDELRDVQDGDVSEMLLAVVRSLVDKPDQVDVKLLAAETSTTFRILVDPTDVGKVIGMNGRTARALRTIVGANGSKLRRSFSVDILERTPPSA